MVLIQLALLTAPFSPCLTAFEEGLGDKSPILECFPLCLDMLSKTHHGKVLASWVAWGTLCGPGHLWYWFRCFHPSFWDHGSLKESAGLCVLQPFYLQSVGFAPSSTFHSVIGSLCVRYPLWSVPYRLEGRSSHQWLRPNLDSEIEIIVEEDCSFTTDVFRVSRVCSSESKLSPGLS